MADTPTTANTPGNLGTLQATLGVNVNPLNKARVEFAKWGADADRQMGRAKTATGGLDRAFGALGVTMAAVFSAQAIVKFTQTAVASFGAMEQSIANVSTLFGDVEVDVSNLQAQIMALSGETGMAAEAIGQALYQSLSAGIPVTRDMGAAMNFVRGAVVLARAGFTDVTTAVEATAKTLNAYRMNVSEAERIHRILIQTQNRGITTVDELGGYLAQVTPIAAALDVSLENVGAALSVMTAQGLRTRVAITQLRSLFTELAQNGSTGADALLRAQQAAGMTQLSFHDLMKSGMSLGDVLNIIRNYADTTGKSVIDLFGSVEAGQAVLSLTGANAAKMNEIFGEMADVTSIVNDSYGKVMGTLEASTNIFKNSVRLFGTVIGQTLAPALNEVIIMANVWLTSTRELISQKAEVWADKLATAVKFVADNLDHAVRFTKGLIGLKLVTWLYNAAIASYGLATALGVVSVAAKTVGRALLIGFAAEIIGYVIDQISTINQVINTTPVTWGDAALMAGEAFINGIVNAIEILALKLPKLLNDLIVQPMAAALIEAFSFKNIFNPDDGKGYFARIGSSWTSTVASVLTEGWSDIYETAGKTRIQIAPDATRRRYNAGVASFQAAQNAAPIIPDITEDADAAVAAYTQMLEEMLAGLGSSQSTTQQYLKTLKRDWTNYQNEITLLDHKNWDASTVEVDLWAATLTAEIKEAEAWSDEISEWIDKVITKRKELVAKEQSTAFTEVDKDMTQIITRLKDEVQAMQTSPAAWQAFKQQQIINDDLEQYVKLLKEAGASQTYIDEFSTNFTTWTKANRDAQKEMERWINLAQVMGETISGVFKQMGDQIISNLIRGKAAFEDFGDLALAILEQVLQQMLLVAIINPLSTGIDKLMLKIFPGAKSADGNVFSQQGLVPFADGGVVTRPTIFPFAKGIGLMGEAGPEGILPLTRVGGKLGVSAVGGGSVVVNINNQGNPLEVSSQSQRQGPDGETIIELTVRNALNRLDGQGQLDGVFNRHGATRKGVR